MKFNDATDLYLADRKRSGHINDTTVGVYRPYLALLADEVDNRDPSLVSALEIEQVLYRWPNPNTYNHARTIYNGFYKWLVRKGHAKTNPVDRIDAPRTRKRAKRRLTRAEARAIMDACRTPRDRRAIYLAGCSGLRNREIRMLQGRHFARPGFIWVSPDIGKGGRERWLPVGPDLQPVVDEIVANVALDEYVLPSLRSFNPGINSDIRPVPNPLSPEGLIDLIAGIAERANIEHRVTPHMLRHYFGELVTNSAGIHYARALLGHASIQTTQIYAGQPSLDDLAQAIGDIEFRLSAQIMAVRAVPDRVPIISSSPESDVPSRFGARLLELKRSFRPLTFGWAA